MSDKVEKILFVAVASCCVSAGKGPVQKVMLLEIDLNMADSLSVSAFTRTVYDQCKNIPKGESSPVVL